MVLEFRFHFFADASRRAGLGNQRRRGSFIISVVMVNIFSVISLHLDVVNNNSGVVFDNTDVNRIGSVSIGQTSFMIY